LIRLIRRRFLLGALLGALFCVGWWAGRGFTAGRGDLYQNLDVFVEVVQKVTSSYVDPVDPTKLMRGAIGGLTHTLDPYSQYLDGAAYQDLEITTHGNYGGVGLVVAIRDGWPVVISPVEGGPAWTLGIRAGDVLSAVDGKSTAGLTLDEVAAKLRGKPGTSVMVTVHREGDPRDRDVSLSRQQIVTKSVPYAFNLPDGVGYLRLADFSEDAGAEVRAALAKLRAGGATRLLLDLRSNPGGLLDQAVSVTEDFVPPRTLVVYTQGRMKDSDQRYLAAGRSPELGWPIVVLVDRGTASASEIVSGALQDLDRALIVGETTFGKGLVQNVFPLRGHGALKLTTARYYTPSGRCINSLASEHLLDSLETADSGDEGDDADTVATTPATPAPTFHTAAGRVVKGGGGIRPDLVVVPDTLPPLLGALEGHGMTFRFANRWVTQHPATRTGDPVSPAMWDAFHAYADTVKVANVAAEWERERPVLERALRIEVARRQGGDAAAARLALAGDPVVTRALQVLGRASRARDVFALAAGPLPRGAHLGRDAGRVPAHR
jgi:carboxyl-terminal processing protease